MPSTRNFADVLRKKVTSNPQLAAAVAEAGFQASIAEVIYDARTQAGLTQTQLARRIGTHQSVIARIEDADYEGHTLSMLRRIADATGKDLVVTFKDKRSKVATVAVGSSRMAGRRSPPSLAKPVPAASKPKSAAPARKKKRNGQVKPAT
jgi:transcriptional regulator with XRE-family HTH domain